MKKILLIIITIVAALSLSSCVGGASFADLVEDDALLIEAALLENPYKLELPSEGTNSKSTITWTYDDKYFTDKNVTVPYVGDDEYLTVELQADFTNGTNVITKTFSYNIIKDNNINLLEKRNVPFTNSTEEYAIANSTLDLLFAEGGNVPFVKVKDFLQLLTGLISEDVEFTYEKDENNTVISYPYVDEDNVHYNLQLVIDPVANTMYTEDPAFYSAYVESTETNYARNISYDKDNPLNYFDEGNGVTLDLNKYSMDIVEYEDEVAIPFYVANQLFASSSYYNVYYNYDSLVGIYAVPNTSKSDPIFKSLKTSTKNGKSIPNDIGRHTFAYLAFLFDYFYGLKEIKEIDTYYDLLLIRRNNLLSPTSSKFEAALFEYIHKTLDEAHSSYSFGGYYNATTNVDPTLTSTSQFGPRVSAFYNGGLFAIDDQIAKKWDITTSSWAAEDPKRPKYWYVDEASTTAVITLDGFDTIDIVEGETLDEGYAKEKLGLTEADAIPFALGGDYYYTMDFSDKNGKAITVLSKGISESEYEDYINTLVSLGFTYSMDMYVLENLVINPVYESNTGLFFVSYALYTNSAKGIMKLTQSIWDIVLSDSAIYLEYVLLTIKAEAPQCKNIILDLTFNSGGNIGALYRIVGFITDKPFIVSSIDAFANQKYSTAVVIDSPYYDDTLNWALLISPVTFSAANELVAIFKFNNLGPVAGVKSGGGASSISPVVIPNGSMFIISSTNIMAVRSGSGTEADPYVYTSTEMGFAPDIAIATSKIYDNDTLMTIFA